MSTLNATVPWMSLCGVAEKLGVSPRTVTRMVECGELPAYRIRRRLQFDRREIETYLLGARIDARLKQKT